MMPATQLRADCLSLLTCSPLVHCPKEDACFRVAKAMLALLPDPIPAEQADEPAMDDNEVMHYAVDWSAT